jgi:hypothetical protein
MSAKKKPPVRPSAQNLQRLDVPMELRCGVCQRTGEYPVGRVFVDPHGRGKGAGWLDRSFGFTGYFRCKHCGAGSPWHLTPTSELMLMALLLVALDSPERARIVLGQMAMFDNTPMRWPAEAEAHLKELIEKEPENYYLWSRLGNVYKTGDAFDLAVEAFHEAIRLNENDVESYHSIADIHLERGEDEEAARYFHQVLRHGRHAPPRSPQHLVRNMVRYALEALADLHLKSDKRIPLMPTATAAEVAAGRDPSEPITVELREFDLGKEEDWERMVDWWVTGKPPTRSTTAPPPAPRPRSSLTLPRRSITPASGQRGRNDPCPCGSGKKFKNCCMRR